MTARARRTPLKYLENWQARKMLSDAEITFEALYDESQRTINVRVKSAVSLSDDQKARLQEKLEQKYKCRVDTQYIIDTTLLGGVIVEADDTVIDGSLRHRIGQIKEVIGR